MLQQSLDEEILLQLSNCTKLSKIRTLNLSKMGISDLDHTMFQKLTSLKELDLSENQIVKIPPYLGLDQLEVLNLADNCLNSIEFLKHFPLLSELDITGNQNLGTTERYISVLLCPRLIRLDGKTAGGLRSLVQSMKSALLPEIEEHWNGSLKKKYHYDLSESNVKTVVSKILTALGEHKTGSSNLAAFRNYLVTHLAREVVMTSRNYVQSPHHLSQREATVPSTIRGTPTRATTRQLKTPEKTPTKVPNTPNRMLRSPSSRTRTPTRLDGYVCSSPKSSTPNKQQKVLTSSGLKNTPTKIDKTPTKSEKENFEICHSFSKKRKRNLDSPEFTGLKKRLVEVTQLPPVPSYDPVHFLRCHSSNNNPGDGCSKLWQCAFEPDLNEKGSTTNIVASCGGHSLCLVDCSTGTVMKKFSKTTEEFYAVAWTTIDVGNESHTRKTNILAIAGKGHTVYLLHPDQLVCYAELQGHKKYISSLLFHPEESTWLFSGSADSKVILWDIGIPDIPDYTTKYQQLVVLNCSGLDILNMAYSNSTGCLIAGCEIGCYVWRLSKDDVKSKKRFPEIEVNLPGFDGNDEDIILDGLTQVADNIFATKYSNDGNIHLWSLPNKLSHRPHVVPLAVLKWTKIETFYINLAYTSGSPLLVCGDNVGQLWLYNVEPLLQDDVRVCRTPLEPSQILPWPICEPGETTEDKAMTDLKEKPKELVINHACVSGSRNYIVAGTDNNLLCIWKMINTAK